MSKAEFVLGLLSRTEKEALRRDMAESSAWARAELKRRREEKAKQNAEHGTNNGTTKEPSPKQPWLKDL